jgi:hypothetical protein
MKEERLVITAKINKAPEDKNRNWKEIRDKRQGMKERRTDEGRRKKLKNKKEEKILKSNM